MSPTPSPRPRVLVVARESVIAALLALLLELENYEPVFPEPGERAEDAIRRVRPPLVVMLDGSLELAASDLFHAGAVQAGARVVLFSEPLSADAVRAVARARRLPLLTMPTTRAAVGDLLRSSHPG